MKIFLSLIAIACIACEELESPLMRIEFVEKIQTCPILSYGAKSFCQKNEDHKCHQICITAPSCCDLNEVFEENSFISN